jgi:hypothetical protein
MATRDQPGDSWTVVLRRQPTRMVEGRPEADYTDTFEIVCCDCDHHPDLDYSQVSPDLQRVPGPHATADGIVARRAAQPAGTCYQQGAMTDAG